MHRVPFHPELVYEICSLIDPLIETFLSFRLRINTLEAEKNELQEDISRLRELSNNGENPINLVFFHHSSNILPISSRLNLYWIGS